MARWIDMTDAEKVALQRRVAAKERAKILANPAYIFKAFSEIEAIAAEIKDEARRARWIEEEKKPYFDRLARLNINPAEIGIGVKCAAIQRQRARLAVNPTLVADVAAVARLHGLEFAQSLTAT